MEKLMWFIVMVVGWLLVFRDLPMGAVIGLVLVSLGTAGVYDLYFKRKE